MTYFSRKIEKIKKNVLKTEGVWERRNEEDLQSEEWYEEDSQSEEWCEEDSQSKEWCEEDSQSKEWC